MALTVETGADAVAVALEELGVDTVFGIIGAGNLAICDAIQRHGASRLIFVHHEQAAIMAAQGYSRTTGRLAVAVVTTGGGSANAVTGVIGGHMDSVPLLVISGNESSIHTHPDNELRIWGIQGFDSRAVFSHVSKASHRARSADQLFDLVIESAQNALEPRRGVVVLDIPMDLQRKPVQDASRSTRRVDPSGWQAPPVARDLLRTLTDAIQRSARPILLLGNGLRSVDRSVIRDQIAGLGLPTVLSWSAADLLDADNAMNFGRTGIYGDRYANLITQNADLVVSLGSRLSIPQLSYDPLDFARSAKVVVVDIDRTELGKFVGDRWIKVNADAADLLDQLSTTGLLSPPSATWLAKCARLRAEFPRREQTLEAIPSKGRATSVNSYEVVYAISDRADQDDIFVTDSGTGLLSSFYGLDIRGSQRLFGSLGLGEMGFGLPAAVGAQFAAPDATVVCMNSDGGIMLNLQELQTIAHHRLPIKLVVFSNDGYLMIRHSQRALFDGRFVGSNRDSGVSTPDLAKLADTFGFGYVRLSDPSQIAEMVERFYAHEGAVLLDVAMHPDQLYIPRVGTIKAENGALISPPLEDMSPLISEASLSAAMDGLLHPESIKIRNVPTSLPVLGGKS